MLGLIEFSLFNSLLTFNWKHILGHSVCDRRLIVVLWPPPSAVDVGWERSPVVVVVVVVVPPLVRRSEGREVTVGPFKRVWVQKIRAATQCYAT